MSGRDDERLMELALVEAVRAPEHGDVPVGCVISRGGHVVAVAHNERELRADPTCHAEVLAIRAAALALGGWRLIGCEMHVTLEPCPMCAGAILQSRLGRVVYGAPDPKGGAAGSCVDLLHDPRLRSAVEVVPGVAAQRSAEILREFFSARRGPPASPAGR